jgi:hypothetical protein
VGHCRGCKGVSMRRGIIAVIMALGLLVLALTACNETSSGIPSATEDTSSATTTKPRPVTSSTEDTSSATTTRPKTITSTIPNTVATTVPKPVATTPSANENKSLIKQNQVSLGPYRDLGAAFFLNPKYASATVGCYHASEAMGLTYGSQYELVAESDYPIIWNSEKGDGIQVRLWLATQFSEATNSWIAGSTNAATNVEVATSSEGKRFVVRFIPHSIGGSSEYAPPGGGLYKVIVLNADFNNSHSLKYTINRIE